LEMAQRRKRAPKKMRPPWWHLFQGKPIQRYSKESWAEPFAQEELRRRLARLCEHYGVSTFRDLTLSIVRDLDPSFTIVDPLPRPKGKTATRWRGTEGLQLLIHVRGVREDLQENTGRKISLEAALEELRERSSKYREMSPGHLNTAYHTAKRHHGTQAQRTRK